MRQLLLLCATLLAACGGTTDATSTTDDAASSDTAAAISADQACADSAQAQCQKLDACKVNGVAMRYGSSDVCIARVKANCLMAMGAPDTGRTAANQEACAVAEAAATCSDYLEGTIAACQAPAGTRALGAACSFSGQCQSAFCAITTGVACGVCAATPTLGQSCATSQCGSGQVCLRNNQTCAAYGAAGASCIATAECKTGLTCVGATASTNTTGTCQAGAETLGAACDHAKGPNCDDYQGLFCSIPPKTTAGTCSKYLTATTGTCGYAAGSGTTGATYTQCLGGAQCIIPTGSNAGTCVPDVIEGKPCDTTNGPGCLSPARCITAPGGTSGTCALPDPTKC